MSHITRGIFGAAAIALTLGAVPLAAGRDRDFSADELTGTQTVTGTPADAVNRAAKADRAPGVARSEAPTRTISLQLNGFTDTSVLVRMPVAQAARANSAPPSWTQSGDRAVGCEPVVSVLIDAAKLLQPGRCVT
jgi:hypothetical protein